MTTIRSGISLAASYVIWLVHLSDGCQNRLLEWRYEGGDLCAPAPRIWGYGTRAQYVQASQSFIWAQTSTSCMISQATSVFAVPRLCQYTYTVLTFMFSKKTQICSSWCFMWMTYYSLVVILQQWSLLYVRYLTWHIWVYCIIVLALSFARPRRE